MKKKIQNHLYITQFEKEEEEGGGEGLKTNKNTHTERQTRKT